jgi:hypothetical protein
MIKTNTKVALAAMLVSLAAAAPQVSGAIDTTGISYLNKNIKFLGNEPSPSGTIIDSKSGNYQWPAAPSADDPITIAGTVLTQVYRETSGPFGAGSLTFVYTIQSSSLADPALSIYSVNLSKYDPAKTPGLQIIVGYDDSGGNVAPVSASWTGRAVQIDFDKDFAISQNQKAVLIVYTNQKKYQGDLVSLIDTGTGNVNGFAPVPEPATYIAGLGALCLFGFTALPKRKN